MTDRAIVVGIDEAGYGPVLGPLVVSAAAFEVPLSLADASLWQVLKASVSSKPRPRDRRVAVVDSKKLYQRKEGIAALERSALAAFSAWRGAPPDAAALLAMLWPGGRDACDGYAWYRALCWPVPLEADVGGVRLAGAKLRRDGEANGVSLAGLFCEPLLEGHYNRLVGATRNKAVVLFGQTVRLMQRVADAFPDQPLFIFADKQGARGHYGRLLMQSFEDRRLVVIEETESTSAYELRSSAAPWRIRFSQEGESQYMPVALASIISKYVRELFMRAFNNFWQAAAPGVAATAGYYTDGMRFIEQIRPHLPRLGIDSRQLVRIQ